jgi:hypothetical protein
MKMKNFDVLNMKMITESNKEGNKKHISETTFSLDELGVIYPQ